VAATVGEAKEASTVEAWATVARAAGKGAAGD